MSSGRRGVAIPLLALVLSFLVVLGVGRWTAPTKPPPPPVVVVEKPVEPPAADPGVSEVEIIGGAVKADSAWQPFADVTMHFNEDPDYGMVVCLDPGVRNWVIAKTDPDRGCASIDTTDPDRTVVRLVRP